MIPVVSRRNRRNTVGKVGSKYYWLYDQFTTDRAAGAVNGTLAEPVGSVRTVTDANGKITISSGTLNFATGGVANDWIYWPGRAHTAGQAFIADFGVRGASTSMSMGFDANTVATTIRNGFNLGTTSLQYITAAAGITGIPVTNTAITLAVIQRPTGFFYLYKGGGQTYWTLHNYSETDAATTEIPEIQTVNTTATVSIDNARIPRGLFVFAPLEADGFSATTTDGYVNPEGINASLAGRSYTAVGTWGVSGGVASCSALSGGLGLRYLATASADVIVEANLTRTGGVGGVVARYADAQNYLIAYHDGTNIKLDKVEGGSTTNLSSTARTYSAGAPVKLTVTGTSAMAQYNNAASPVVTVPSSTAKNHGLYTTDTGNTFDNLEVWARGTANEYTRLDAV